MKKLQDNLAARIAASVILTVSFLLTLLSTAGIVLLASYQAYNDGGAQLRTSYLHAAGVQEYYDHVEPVLEGLVHEPQSYQNYLNSLNVHVDVKTTDGTTVFSNAKEGETSLLEGPFSYTFTTGETKLWKNTFSDAEKAKRALERFPTGPNASITSKSSNRKTFTTIVSALRSLFIDYYAVDFIRLNRSVSLYIPSSDD